MSDQACERKTASNEDIEQIVADMSPFERFDRKFRSRPSRIFDVAQFYKFPDHRTYGLQFNDTFFEQRVQYQYVIHAGDAIAYAEKPYFEEVFKLSLLTGGGEASKLKIEAALKAILIQHGFFGNPEDISIDQYEFNWTE